MLFLKYLLLCGGMGMIVGSIVILTRDFYFEMKYRQSLAVGAAPKSARPGIHWRNSLALALLAWGPILLALSIVVVPSAQAQATLVAAQASAAKDAQQSLDTWEADHRRRVAEALELGGFRE